MDGVGLRSGCGRLHGVSDVEATIRWGWRQSPTALSVMGGRHGRGGFVASWRMGDGRTAGRMVSDVLAVTGGIVWWWCGTEGGVGDREGGQGDDW